MADYDRIEPESETHRTEKALRAMAPSVRLPFERGDVEILIGSLPASSSGGQRLLTMLVQLLARMKGVVRHVRLVADADPPVREGVPLVGSSLFDGLGHLVSSLNGPASEFRSELSVARSRSSSHVSVALGDFEADIALGSDAWRALVGRATAAARWQDCSPLGPYMAAAIGASEILKLLLNVNFGYAEGRRVGDLAFSLASVGVDESAEAAPDITVVHLDDLSIAGAGAGGTAAVYTLSSFARIHGRLTVVEPGSLKMSNLGRYLLSDYGQVHSGIHKIDSLGSFLEQHAPGLAMDPHRLPWDKVQRRWGRVVCTVDTPEARWDVQRSNPQSIVEAGAMGTLYTVLRVLPGGWCLKCKHPPDPDITWKRRAARWGLSIEEVKERDAGRAPIVRADLDRLAEVQGRPVEDFVELEGVPFDQVPSRTECGETPLSIAVPSQAPVLPMATTAAGIMLAAEVVKDVTGVGRPLGNFFDHDLRFRPRADRHRFKRRLADCLGCAPISSTDFV